MDAALQDLFYGLRMLRRRPAFTVVAILTLALGIGANSAIFSVVNAVLLRPLPYKNADNLVMLWSKFYREGAEKVSVSAPEFTDFKTRSKSFEHIVAYYSQGFNLTGVSEPERLQGTFVSPDTFTALGINPIQGRSFLSDEDQLGHDQVVLLSHSLWERRFASDPGLVGKSLTLDGKAVTVVGIMPASFMFPTRQTDVWKPLVFTPDLLSENNRGSHFLTVIGRIKTDTTLSQTQSEMSVIGQQLSTEHPSTYRSGYGAYVTTMRNEVVGDIRLTLLVLFGAVGFVLLIACANVANLLLSRAASRQREVAVRAALGAGRGRLVRQFLTESILLSLCGGALGLILAIWGVSLLVSLAPSDIPRLNEIRLDPIAIAFTLIISLFTGLLFGLAPALHASRTNLGDSLKDGGRGSTDSAARHLFRKGLIVAEFALTMVLLIGAGLMVKSFVRLQEVKPGFETGNRLSMRIALPASKYPDFIKQTAFFQEITSRLSSRPGIESVGAISALPLSGFTNDRTFRIEGRPDVPGQPTPDEEIRFVSPAYFSTMGIPVLKGRAFTERDNADATRVVVINQALQARYWPDEDAIGKRITYNGKDGSPTWWEIVGVVGNIKHDGMDSREQPEVYLPYLQPLFSTATSRVSALFFVVKTATDAKSNVGAIRAEIAALDNDQPIFDVKTMGERVNESVAQRRFNMLLIAIFASVAMILAAVGIYGIISYSVAERTNEIGIRVALGAQSGDVFRLVIGQGMLLSLIGVGIGVVGAIGITRLMSTLLFNVTPSDPETFVSISVLLIVVALVACFIPARRATKVDPMVALRYE